MADKFLLKDHLFNPTSMAQLGAEYSTAVAGFDAARFQADALSGFAERELLARLEWIADCIETQLARDFPTLATQLEAAMPTPLDPRRDDDDFGHFIHAVPGILAVRHGLEDHRERAMQLLYAATQRFSMEFYIRPFLNRWPDETLAQLTQWAQDDNYHVRRLVSEGTRPKLPWAKSVTLSTAQTLPLLDHLHGDPTRYVTRSVANHLNDISKKTPDVVVQVLADWRASNRQSAKELGWMTKHALRGLIKDGHAGALALLGYRNDVAVSADLTINTPRCEIGKALEFSLDLTAQSDLPVIVDYRITFARENGKTAQKVFKLKVMELSAQQSMTLRKRHTLKADATTFTWYPGPHAITIQLNGRDVAHAEFEVLPAA